MPSTQLRTKLRQCFELGEIHLGSIKTQRIFPAIQSVRIRADRTELVFTIPLGLNPDKITKAEWLFAQQFGENIEINREGKRFTVMVNHRPLPDRFTYEYAEIEPIISDMALPVVSGRDRNGYVAYDMVAYPHLLIAGETGSGKSVQLRSILTTLIKTKPTDELTLYLADLKRSEFHLFKRIEHVKGYAVEHGELMVILRKIKAEMNRRGTLLDSAEVAHIDDLDEKLPYIVLCIDEFALLKDEKDAMSIIDEIGAIGRALGVFLILSMQRPDREVLDGRLKNNLTVRMAFRHADEINSRITIGSGEAAEIKLTEKGRHYLKHEKLRLIQAPYLTLTEAKKLLEPYRVVNVENTVGELYDDDNSYNNNFLLGVLDYEDA
jgi:S-DNA-T family DNA segregation ATPase FtsK/SpoIIIE